MNVDYDKVTTSISTAYLGLRRVCDLVGYLSHRGRRNTACGGDEGRDRYML